MEDSKKKLEFINRKKRHDAPGVFPGMNRARVFRDKRKELNKRKCREKLRLPTE